MIEQLETDRQIAIAEVKQKVHVEMEGKDAELTEIRSQGLVLQEENAALKEKLEKLEKTGTLYVNDTSCCKCVLGALLDDLV